jgi:hypothetical protein
VANHDRHVAWLEHAPVAGIRVRELLGVNGELDGCSLPRLELHMLKA